MNIRKHIISLLETPPTQCGNLERLYNCLEQDGKKVSFEEFTLWFKGVIDALYYKPNRKCLVLCGKQNTGKTEFFRRILTSQTLYSEIDYPSDLIYKKLLCCFSEGMKKSLLKITQNDNYIIVDPEGTSIYPSTDKRLSSYCVTTSSWQHPNNDNFIVVKIKDIDRIGFNKISKIELWREIFHLYKQGKI